MHFASELIDELACQGNVLPSVLAGLGHVGALVELVPGFDVDHPGPAVRVHLKQFGPELGVERAVSPINDERLAPGHGRMVVTWSERGYVRVDLQTERATPLIDSVRLALPIAVPDKEDLGAEVLSESAANVLE